MTTTECPLCKAKIKARGFYEAHAKAREHMFMAHPNEMAELQQAEIAARRQYNNAMEPLYQKYGLAVRPLNMNL